MVGTDAFLTILYVMVDDFGKSELPSEKDPGPEAALGRMEFFRLEKERPHILDGFQANLAAKMALHTRCIWLNRQLGREPLAFPDLFGC